MKIEDYNYFDQNRKLLARQYPDKWLLIKDQKVLFAVDTLKEAHVVRRENNIDDCLIDFCHKDGKERAYRIRQSFRRVIL